MTKRKFLTPPRSWQIHANAAGWIAATYAAQQIIRLFSSILLAWLLAPALLGTMLLINALRTGGELLTDVGIGQSIVNNRRGEDPAFFNTAWTIQLLRGALLFFVALALTVPIAHAYDKPELLILLPAVAPLFIFTGLTSPARFLLQKRMEVRKLALFDLGSAVFGASAQILLAFLMPTVWALIWGLLIGTAVPAIASFFLIDWRMHRLRWEKEAVHAIIHFGKWIFLSSIVYFLAMNFDRLYLADVIPLALLGIYGIARTFADAVTELFQRLGNFLIFPKVSATGLRGAELSVAIAPMRLALLGVVACGLALGVALADQFIYLVYDARYHDAGFFLSVLLVGTWFAILSAMAEAMMMGIGKPSGVAFGNGVKFAVIAFTLPILLPRFGLNAAMLAFVIAEAARYAVLAWRKRRTGLQFLRHDVVLTLAFFALIFLFREATSLLGLTGGVSDWVREGMQVHG
ncbi:oligosaccharide flippase family protein [Sphingopyxis sp.]|uniref:oligosaccharide flippase family protein n=1 Tax=Sphingopyxis sp. TaxID=1908224 RepID=UPI003BA86E34